MALTLKAVLYEARADGTRSVAIRITIDRKIKYWPTGLLLSEKYWNNEASREKTNWIRKSHPEAERFNRIIKGRIKEADEIADILKGIEPLTATRLKEALEICEKRQDREPITSDRLRAILNTGSESVHLTGFWAQFIRDASDSMQINHEAQFKQLHQFFSRAGEDGLPIKDSQGRYINPILFRELTHEKLSDWVYWLKNERKNIDSTVQNKLVRLKSVLDAAVEQELIPLKLNPLRKWEPKTIVYEHEPLTLEEWMKLETLLPSMKVGSPSRNVLQIYRFQYYARGMRIGDALRIKPQNLAKGRLRYRMGKSKKRIRSIQLHDKLRAIIVEYLELRQSSKWKGSPYLFPFLKRDIESLPYKTQLKFASAATRNINHKLKILAKDAGIEKNLSTHVARHTFSINALLFRSDDGNKPFDIYDVSKAMGHGSVTLTQEFYGDHYEEEESDIIDKVFYQDVSKEEGEGFMKRA